MNNSKDTSKPDLIQLLKNKDAEIAKLNSEIARLNSEAAIANREIIKLKEMYIPNTWVS